MYETSRNDMCNGSYQQGIDHSNYGAQPNRSYTLSRVSIQAHECTTADQLDITLEYELTRTVHQVIPSRYFAKRSKAQTELDPKLTARSDLIQPTGSLFTLSRLLSWKATTNLCVAYLI